MPGNPRCDDLGLQHGYKVDRGAKAGTYNLTQPKGGKVTIEPNDGFVFSWSTQSKDPFMDAVIVKGSAAANVYRYVPEAETGAGLVAPISSSGGVAMVSHVEFCYDLLPALSDLVLSPVPTVVDGARRRSDLGHPDRGDPGE